MSMEFDEPFKSKDSKSETPRPRQSDWIDATDNLEAVEAIKGWKNFIFTIALIAIILVQIIFWLTNTGIIFTAENQPAPAAALGAPTMPASIEGSSVLTKPEPNQPALERHRSLKNIRTWLSEIKPVTFSNILKIVNTVLILSVIIYCLILLASVQIAVAGRLGGINHICRGFFISLILVVILLPWQKIFPGYLVGYVFSSQELINAHNFVKTGDALDQFVYYARYCLLWLLEFILLLSAQFRSIRWSKAILRRLEVI